MTLERPAEDSPKAFLVKAGNAALRVIVLIAMGAIHILLEKGMMYLIPDNMPWARLWLQDIAFAFFVLIYVYLLWDVLKVFVPLLQAKGPYPGLAEATENDQNR